MYDTQDRSQYYKHNINLNIACIEQHTGKEFHHSHPDLADKHCNAFTKGKLMFVHAETCKIIDSYRMDGMDYGK